MTVVPRMRNFGACRDTLMSVLLKQDINTCLQSAFCKKNFFICFYCFLNQFCTQPVIAFYFCKIQRDRAVFILEKMDEKSSFCTDTNVVFVLMFINSWTNHNPLHAPIHHPMCEFYFLPTGRSETLVRRNENILKIAFRFCHSGNHSH